MLQDFRRFRVTDPFGRQWDVEFRWHQNAISIRHADAVDVKYYIGDGEVKRELVLALGHPDLLNLAKERGRELTDAWVIHLAGLHVQEMIESWTDMERTLVMVPLETLRRHNAALEESAAEANERARLTH